MELHFTSEEKEDFLKNNGYKYFEIDTFYYLDYDETNLAKGKLRVWAFTESEIVPAREMAKAKQLLLQKLKR